MTIDNYCTAYLLTGSNLNGPQLQLQQAATAIEEKGLGKITAASSLYQTQAWGQHNQPDFLNQVLRLETALTAPALLKAILQIEADMGRQRTHKNDPRIIDIDILFYEDAIIQTPELTVPHPLLQARRFVLVPLAELAPTLLHPVLHKTISQLLDECADPLEVHKFADAGRGSK